MTVNFTVSETVQTPSVTLLGVAATVTNTGANHWSATATVDAATSQGAAAFLLTASDPSGNAASALNATTDGSSVIVDRGAPLLSLPADIVIEATSPAGASVAFEPATATDALTALPSIVYSQASGTIFPVGVTTVTVSATDAAANTATGTFSVLVNATDVDKAGPQLVITTPKAGLVTGAFTISGTVKENVALKSFTVKLNGAPLALDAPLDLVPGARTPWRVSTATPENGPNLLVVEAEDFAGRKAVATRSLTHLNQRPELAGTYCAVLVSEGAPSLGATGFLSVKVTATGGFSGKLQTGPTTVPFSGTLQNDGAARFKPALDTSLAFAVNRRIVGGSSSFQALLKFSIAAPSGIRGTFSAADSNKSVLAAFAGRKAPYSAKTPVPAALLNLTTRGSYNLILPTQAQVPGRLSSTYPQGDGYARLTLKKTGDVTLSGYLADGTKYVAAGKLRADHTVPLFTLLYKKGGSFTADLAFADLPDSDLSGADLLWLRPANHLTGFYQDGWPLGIRTGALGTRYAKPGSLNFGQGAADPLQGNTALLFSDGILQTPIGYMLSIDPNTGTPSPLPGASYTVKMETATGLFRGTLSRGMTRDSFSGLLLNKGANQGGFGFFLSAPDMPSGQGGGVSLTPNPHPLSSR